VPSPAGPKWEDPEVLALSHHADLRLAEVGYLLIVFAGVWIVASEVPALKIPVARRIVAGVALVAAGIVLILATHYS
jgi:hypothetical protein